MYCDDGKVCGKTALPGTSEHLAKYDSSSKEKSTGIFIQYSEEVQKVFGITTGVKHAIESNRITVKCE
jgi:hypothetical protein